MNELNYTHVNAMIQMHERRRHVNATTHTYHPPRRYSPRNPYQLPPQHDTPTYTRPRMKTVILVDDMHNADVYKRHTLDTHHIHTTPATLQTFAPHTIITTPYGTVEWSALWFDSRYNDYDIDTTHP